MANLKPAVRQGPWEFAFKDNSSTSPSMAKEEYIPRLEECP